MAACVLVVVQAERERLFREAPNGNCARSPAFKSSLGFLLPVQIMSCEESSARYWPILIVADLSSTATTSPVSSFPFQSVAPIVVFVGVEFAEIVLDEVGQAAAHP